MGSAAAGVRAAAAINADLIAEETRTAVAAHRARTSGEAPATHRAASHSEDHAAHRAASHGEDHAAHHAPAWDAEAHRAFGSDEEFWDARYAESSQIWSGKPNVILVREVADLTPGRALDLGSGEGGDAIWLASLGWQVTAADISGVALDRAAAHAKAAGVPDGIDWQRHDLGASFPEGVFELVSACFLHSQGDMPREKILRTAAAAVAPGGVLLIAGHAGWPSWEQNPHPEMHFPTTQEVLDALDLPEGEWEVQVSEEYERDQIVPEGRLGARLDNVLKLRRRA
jgi:SAM-dependent methyltransferase